MRVAPPLVFGAALAAGLVASRVASVSTFGTRARRALGAASIVAGAACGAAALREFRSAGSSPNPFAPATALAIGGPFRFTRNPAYVGATSLYVGVALLARSIPAFVALPVALALVDRFVVDPEERYLERRFGDAYRGYRGRVPRWF